MKLNHLYIAITAMLFVACGGGGSNDDGPEPTFEWTASPNTDSYEVSLRNLNTGNITTTPSATNEVAITILRGTPYQWFVISKANGTNVTSSSTSWRFYNQGLGVENYAPFPAEVVSPARGSTLNTGGDVRLEWIGSDVDNDITAYEVLLGTAATPTVSIGTATEQNLTTTVTGGQSYFWRVITTDSQGNTSQSEIFEFTVR